MKLFDRSDAEDARRIFGQLYPNEAMLRTAATILADSVAVAHTAGSGSWSVTLVEHMVRLNVGQVEVCTLGHEGIKLVVCTPESTPQANGLTFQPGDGPAYRAVPIDSAHLYLDGRVGDSIPHEYIEAHHAYIKEAARRKQNSPYKRAFSVGVLLFLETELKLRLPRPSYFDNLDVRQDELAEAEAAAKPFDPSDERDGRERVLATLVRRRGQAGFRGELLRAYRGRCAISGCPVEDVLEAAHIMPYRGEHTNHVCNGILLRSDLHVLFDLDLFEIDPDSYSIIIGPKLARTPYAEFDGKKLRLPEEEAQWPDREALRLR